MVRRALEPEIRKYLFKRKTIIIYGARQVGKTTLVEHLTADWRESTLFLNGDDADTRVSLTGINPVKVSPLLGSSKIVVIDEAQRLPEPGLTLKILHDNFRDLQVIATGSSSFDLARKVNEPMTGRKLEFFLHPFSFAEMVAHHGLITEKRSLEHRMIYGYYPDIVLNQGFEQRFLKSLASSFLYKDLLTLEQIHKPVLLEKILKALALQVGSEVSFQEVARLVGSDRGTVEKYVDLLEKSYLIFRLNGLNRNVRNEIKKGRKIYFFDNGIRNAILGNFLPLSSRVDTGALWENFLVSERVKLIANTDTTNSQWFWRTTQQQEIDYIEERNGTLFAFEFKWGARKRAALSKTFSNAYPVTKFEVVTPENAEEFLTVAG